jgi:hypothetical protein
MCAVFVAKPELAAVDRKLAASQSKAQGPAHVTAVTASIMFMQSWPPRFSGLELQHESKYLLPGRNEHVLSMC